VDGSVSISVGSIIGLVGFLFQVGLTVGLVALGYGALKQRVIAVEEKQKEHTTLSQSVVRLEAELESVGREIKAIREDMKSIRDILDRARAAARA